MHSRRWLSRARKILSHRLGLTLANVQTHEYRVVNTVKVSVRAYAWAIFFPAYKRGQAGVYSQPIIY